MQTTPPRIKICCIQDSEEAALAIQYGADAVGLVSAMPSGPGPIADETIRAIAGGLPPRIASFLLTSRQDATQIIAQVRRAGVTTVQIVDRLVVGTHRDLREALPAVKVVQVIHVTGERSVDEAEAVSHDVDALLLDSGDPSAPVKELGGTGRIHDWQLSRRIVDVVDVPVWLAGGLTAGNVAEAVQRVQPYGLDVCSGVRIEGRLDEGKLAAFTKAARG